MKHLYSLFLFLLGFLLNTTNLRAQQMGSLDTSFDPGTGANNDIITTALLLNGKIIIGGGFTSYNGRPVNRIARLHINGSLDTTFNIGTGADGRILSVAMQADGRIIMGGEFTSYDSISRKSIGRLNANGSLDSTFNPGTGANQGVMKTIIQADGKIIIGGYFTSFNGTPINRIARLNTNGSLDSTFIPVMGANGVIWDVVLQPDGKIIIVGEFTSFNGILCNRIVRLNADGSLDTSFNSGMGADDKVLTTSLQTDGKIIIGGEFTSYNGLARNHIARLNNNGSLDQSFNPGTGTNDWIRTTAIQADGKIFIGGSFNIYDGFSRYHLTRINSDGSHDFYFNTGIGTSSNIYTSMIQVDGKIIIGGSFNTYNATSRNHIARINGGSPTGIVKEEKGLEVKLYPNPNLGKFQLQFFGLNTGKASLTITDLTGRIILQKDVEACNGCISEPLELKAAKGVYLLTITANQKRILRKVVLE
jgi:uncharacterized delta-60 repeat protein